MQSIRSFVQKRFWTLMMLFVAGGFAMLLLELLLTQHTDGIQLVAVAASLAGLVLAVVGLFASQKLRVLLAVLFVLLSLSGIIGVFEHFESRGGEGERAQRPALVTTSAGGAAAAATLRFQEGDGDDDESRQPGEFAGRSPEGEGTPPPLAPLSLAGLSLIGAVVLLGWRDGS